MIQRLTIGPANEVANLALAASAAFTDEWQADLVKRLAKAKQSGATYGDLLRITEEVLAQYAGPLATILADGRMAALLVGAGEVAGQVGHLGGFPPVPPHLGLASDWAWDGDPEWRPIIEAAESHLRGLRLLTKPQWEAASQRIRQNAFTAAGVQTQEALGHIRDALLTSVVEGTGLKAFRERMKEQAETSELGPGRLEAIQRTAVNGAYHAGQERVAGLLPDVLPYRKRLPIEDSRITDLCYTLARSGIDGGPIYRGDDPVWQKTRPLSHWQCRCGVAVLTVEQAAREGIGEAQRWLTTGQEPAVPAWVKWPKVEMPRDWIPGGSIMLA